VIGDHRLVFTCVSLLTGVFCAALRDRRALLLEHLLLRQQLAVALRTRRRPCVRWHDRLFWVVMQRRCAYWHRRGWRLFWWWRSRQPTGRPRLPREVRDLLRRLSEENRLWGTERIRGELLDRRAAIGRFSLRLMGEVRSLP